ncbi:MAG: serine hydrolase domain-containing protein, partial [Promethearchaeota archaeon]
MTNSTNNQKIPHNNRMILIILAVAILGTMFTQMNTLNLEQPSTEQFLPLDLKISNSQPSTVYNLDDLGEIAAFFDEQVPAQLEQANIVGATVAVVRGNETIFTSGYGYADQNASRVVDPNRTLFRVGSISKLFTWTAIMQLYEQGLVDLHTDINEYLTAFQIAETFEEPITLHHIMTHTAGFEETLKPSIYPYNAFPGLEDVLKEGLPPRHWAPGTIPAYSNYATALAGYIVEEISGVPFATYIQEQILNPLNMTHSTFLEPIPANLTQDMSVGYYNDGDIVVEGFFEHFSFDPAGSFSSTAQDMAKFMNAFLNNGSFEVQQLLQPETVTLMQTPQFSPHPDFPSIRYGFYDVNLLNHNTFGHGGDTIFFHSQLTLIPEYDLGLFISYNSLNGGGKSLQLHAQFVR